MSMSPQHLATTTPEYQHLPEHTTLLTSASTSKAPLPLPTTDSRSFPTPHKILASDTSVEGSPPSSPENVRPCPNNNCCSLFLLNDASDTDAAAAQSNPCRCSRTSWSVESHRALVAHVFEVGLQKASPSVIIENMKDGAASLSGMGITKEKIKSHLQKYRAGKDRSKADFLNEFDTWIRTSREKLVDQNRNRAGTVATSDDISKIADLSTIGAGEMAASLSLCCMLDDHAGDRATSTAETDLAVDLDDFANNVSALLDIGGALTVPTLTADEEATPLGKMMFNIMGCFSTLQKRLEEQRQRHPPEELNDDDDHSDSSCSEFFDLDPVLLSPTRKRPFSPTLATDVDHHPMLTMPMMILSPPITPIIPQSVAKGNQHDVPSLQLPPAAIPKKQQPESFQPTHVPQKPQQQQLQQLCWRPPLRMHRGMKIGYPRAPAKAPTPPQSNNINQSSQATTEQSGFVMNKRMRLVGPPAPPPPLPVQGSQDRHGHGSISGGVGTPFGPPFHNAPHLCCPTVVTVWRQEYLVRALPRFSPPLWNGPPPMYPPILPSWSTSHMKHPPPPQQGTSQNARHPSPYHVGHDGQGASVQPK